MRYIIFILLLFPIVVTAQNTDTELLQQVDNAILGKTYSAPRAGDMHKAIINSKVSRRETVNAVGVNTYSASANGGITSYDANLSVSVRFLSESTSAVTINLNSIGAKKVYKTSSEQAGAGDIKVRQVYTLVYDTDLDGGIGAFLIIGSGSGGAAYTASNGLSLSGANFKLGGTSLTESVNIDGDFHDFEFSNVTNFNVRAGFKVLFDVPSIESTVDNDFIVYNSSNNNALSQGGAGTTITLDEANLGTFSVNNSEPIFSIGQNAEIKAYNKIDYTEDFSLNDLSLTPKVYADNHLAGGAIFPVAPAMEGQTIIWNSGSQQWDYAPRGITSAGNGLTVTGNSVAMGGTASSNIIINSATSGTNSFNIGTTVPFSAFSLRGGNATSSGTVNSTSVVTAMSRTVSGVSTSINLNSSGALLTDGIGQKGWVYAADYSGNADNLTVVPKIYIDNQVATRAPLYPTGNVRIANYTALFPEDVGKPVLMNSTSGALTFTVPANSVEPFPLWTYLIVYRTGSNSVTIIPGTDVVINASAGVNTIPEQWTAVTLFQTAINTWILTNGTASTGGGGSGVASVTGTDSRITIGGTASAPVIDIAANYAGQNTITNVGNLTAGSTSTGFTINFGASTIAGRLPLNNFVQGPALSLLGVSGNAAGDYAPITGATDQVMRVDATGSSIGFGTVNTNGIANNAITYGKLQNASGGMRILGRSAVSSGALGEIVAASADLILRSTAGGLGFGAINLASSNTVGTSILGTANGGTGTATPSGRYTPTLTNVANLDGSTAYQCQWVRVGDVVTVSGRVDLDITTISTATQLDISLPVPSAFTGFHECAGTAVSPSGSSVVAAIMAEATNDRATLQFVTPSGSAFSMFFHFTYSVL